MNLKKLIIRPFEEGGYAIVATISYRNGYSKDIILNTSESPGNLQDSFVTYMTDEDSLYAEIEYQLQLVV